MKKYYSPWPNSPSSTGEPRGSQNSNHPKPGMQQEIIEYGTEHKVTVKSADAKLIVVGDENKRGFLLAFHNIAVENLPKEGDKTFGIFGSFRVAF